MRTYISSFRGPFASTEVEFQTSRRPQARDLQVEEGHSVSILDRWGVALYDVKFKNRLLAAFSGANILGSQYPRAAASPAAASGGATYRASPARWHR
jgi:iron complex outermembrane receptor protein